MAELIPTPIPGLVVVRLDVHHDSRGWFKETWHKERLHALGVPDLRPVQHNVSFNHRRGVTRGIHAEPWTKIVSLASGRAFAAWVDLRPGEGFGRTHHLELDPSVAVVVPRGVGNSYQALEDGTAYTYLADAHWRTDVTYPSVDLADPALAIPWPIPLEKAALSAKDRANPALADVVPLQPRRPLIVGAGGQLGRALRGAFPEADRVSVREVPGELEQLAWGEYDVVLNAAAYTDVDAAETPEGRRTAWIANAALPAALARIADEHRLTLVHYSSDYVFDGSHELHREDEPFSPLSVYGQSKAAGDLAVGTCSQHLILRTSWLVGDGPGFVSTMRDLAARGVSPEVVTDQVGRLTFTGELARATAHLLERGVRGTVNVTNAGPTMSWWEIARRVFELSDRDPDDVRRSTTAQRADSVPGAPRPLHSTLDLTRLEQSGFTPEPAVLALERTLTKSVPTQPPTRGTRRSRVNESD